MQNCRKWLARIFMLLISFLGAFGALASRLTTAYAPANFMRLTGKVVDKHTQEGIPGIRLRLLRGAEQLSKEDGTFDFFLSYSSTLNHSLPTVTIILEDIDGELNGLYQTVTNVVPLSGRPLIIPLESQKITPRE